MGLRKLTIAPEPRSPGLLELPVVAMFNPNTYTISKAVNWKEIGDIRTNAPIMAFGGGGARELKLELFFDSTEGRDRDVRSQTDELVLLTRIQRDKTKSRPPLCTVSWDEHTTKDFPFTGFITALTQNFTLFHESGVPMRATLGVTFKEFLSREEDLRKTDPEMTTYTVRRGDTLAGIAERLAVPWRDIAARNPQIKNPRTLAAGQTLVIPKV